MCTSCSLHMFIYWGRCFFVHVLYENFKLLRYFATNELSVESLIQMLASFVEIVRLDLMGSRLGRPNHHSVVCPAWVIQEMSVRGGWQGLELVVSLASTSCVANSNLELVPIAVKIACCTTLHIILSIVAIATIVVPYFSAAVQIEV